MHDFFPSSILAKQSKARSLEVLNECAIDWNLAVGVSGARGVEYAVVGS